VPERTYPCNLCGRVGPQARCPECMELVRQTVQTLKDFGVRTEGSPTYVAAAIVGRLIGKQRHQRATRLLADAAEPKG
jgi:hypothetical protein